MGRGLKRAVCLGAVICTLAVAVGADPLVGLWASPPDGKGQTGIVQIKPCGDAYCGTLIKAFDPNGKQIVTKKRRQTPALGDETHGRRPLWRGTGLRADLWSGLIRPRSRFRERG